MKKLQVQLKSVSKDLGKLSKQVEKIGGTGSKTS